MVHDQLRRAQHIMKQLTDKERIKRDFVMGVGIAQAQCLQTNISTKVGCKFSLVPIRFG